MYRATSCWRRKCPSKKTNLARGQSLIALSQGELHALSGCADICAASVRVALAVPNRNIAGFTFALSTLSCADCAGF
jgi:hypothetical protein